MLPIKIFFLKQQTKERKKSRKIERSNRQNVTKNSNETDETETENKIENEDEIYGLNISKTEDDMTEDDSRARKRTHSDVDKDENEIGRKIKEVREREHK